MSLHIWRRGVNGKLSTHFSKREFECSCGICAEQQISLELVDRLEKVRLTVGLPLIITSAYRCARKQTQLRSQGLETSSGKSSHEEGQAADVVCSDMKKLELACLSLFDNVGIASSFIHVDVRARKSDGSKRIWTYKKV